MRFGWLSRGGLAALYCVPCKAPGIPSGLGSANGETAAKPPRREGQITPSSHSRLFEGSGHCPQHQAALFEVVSAFQEMRVSLLLVISCERDFDGAFVVGHQSSVMPSSSASAASQSRRGRYRGDLPAKPFAHQGSAWEVAGGHPE